MPLTPSGINQSLVGLAPAKISLHEGFPGSTGANEIAGVTRLLGAYTDSGNQQTLNTPVVFSNVPGGKTVLHHGMWDVTDTIFLGSAPTGSSTAKIGTSTGSTDTILSYAHGLDAADAAKNKIVCFTLLDYAIPTNIVVGALCNVVNHTTDTFQLSLTAGGAAMDIGNGFVLFYGIVPTYDALAFKHEVTTFTTTGY